MGRAFESAVIYVSKEKDTGCVSTLLREYGETFRDGVMQDEAEQ